MCRYGTGPSCINDNVKFDDDYNNSNNIKNQPLIHAFRDADCICIVTISVLFADLDHVCESHVQRMLVDGNISVLPYKKNSAVRDGHTSITKGSEIIIIIITHWFLVTQDMQCVIAGQLYHVNRQLCTATVHADVCRMVTD